SSEMKVSCSFPLRRSPRPKSSAWRPRWVAVTGIGQLLRYVGDREVGRVVGNSVVAEHTRWAERRADRVGADRFTLNATVGDRHAIRLQEAAERPGERRVVGADDLAGGIRRYRRR